MELRHELTNDMYRAYRTELESDRLVRATRTTALVVIALFTSFIALDRIAYPEHFKQFLSVRLTVNIVLAAIYLRFARSHPLQSAIVGCLTIGAGLLAVIQGAGGLLGEYYVGLVLLFVGMPVFMPFSSRQASLIVVVLLGTLASLPFIEAGEIDWRTYLLHLFFPAAAAVECVASCAVLDNARFNDFRQRRELEQARDHLKELDREKSRFTANVHHELRTPLTLMLAPIDAMLDGEFGDVAPLQREYLETIRSNGLRLLKLINNLLDLAKIEGNQLRIVRQRLDLSQLIGQLVKNARPMAERKHIRLAHEGFSHVPFVHADHEAIEKAIVNLIGNSLKFTDPGGRITITGEANEDRGVRITVSDTGIGLEANQLDRVFDRFAQVDSSSTRRHEGTGIGLALVHELIGLHGGTIHAESDGLGHGTRMVITLPLGEPDEEIEENVLRTDDGQSIVLATSIAAMQAEIEHSHRGSLQIAEITRNVERNDFSSRSVEQIEGKTLPDDACEVLVCEDNADMRRLLAFLVGQEFRVRVAKNGREGLAEVLRHRPDLVLTDVMMPEMSGTELCKALKSDPETQSIPVVLVTSKAEREMKIEGLELGADDYVTKPFHPRELMARVRSLVRMHRLQDELARQNALLNSTNAELSDTLDELREAGVRLVQAERLAAVGEIAAGVAHEVNNPMNFALNALRSIRIYSDDVLRAATSLTSLNHETSDGTIADLDDLKKLAQVIDFEEIRDSLPELLEIMEEGLDRTQRLVGDLRDFASPGEDRRTDVDLARGLRTTIQLVSHAFRDSGVSLHHRVPESLPPLSGDSRALNQVVLNLLKNAMDAHHRSHGNVWLEASHSEDSIIVTVRDDGPGIPPEVLPRVFDPFFSTKGAGHGTGLGLSISQRIVDDHGGSLEVSSNAGMGSEFTLRLPISRHS